VAYFSSAFVGSRSNEFPVCSDTGPFPQIFLHSIQQ